MNFRIKSPKRRSLKSRSPKRRSPKRSSLKRRSPKRRSLKRNSLKRKSPKRKSPKRRSPKRKSPKRKSPKSRSPKLNSRSFRLKSHMLRGGTRDDKICDKCHKPLDDSDGKEKTSFEGEGILKKFWVHNETHEKQCKADQIVFYKKNKEKADEALARKAEEEAIIKDREISKQKAIKKILTELAKKKYDDEISKQKAKKKVKSELKLENDRVDNLSDEKKEEEKNGEFFKLPDPKKTTFLQSIIINREKHNRAEYKRMQEESTTETIQDVEQKDKRTNKITIIYSVDSINKTNPHYKKSNPYSIEIHCTTFRPENNPNNPPQNFYGHVTLNIHRHKKEEGGIHTEKYHYGVYPDKDGIIQSFTRKFWINKTEIIQKPIAPLFVINDENKHLEFLFPKISAGNLMIKYYNWCIRNCPKKGAIKSLTRWGNEKKQIFFKRPSPKVRSRAISRSHRKSRAIRRSHRKSRANHIANIANMKKSKPFPFVDPSTPTINIWTDPGPEMFYFKTGNEFPFKEPTKPTIDISGRFEFGVPKKL